LRVVTDDARRHTKLGLKKVKQRERQRMEDYTDNG
jgi:hypothetical protein